MRLFKSRAARITGFVIGAILLFALLVILFISPITKYVIEKYDEKWTGRKITMSWAYVNPFTGFVHLNNVKIYEYQSDSLMLSVGDLSGKFNLRRMLHGFYEISQLVFDHPVGNIVQTDKHFNFDSFISTIAGDNTDTTTATGPSKFNIMDIKVKQGEFHYLQKEIPVTYFIKGANLESSGKLWDADTVLFKYFFLSGPGSGSLEGTFAVNFKNLDYHYLVVVKNYDISQIEQYIRQISNFGTFRAVLDGRMTAVGNFSDAENTTGRGNLTLSDFHFGKNRDEDYLSFDKLILGIDELSPKNKKYMFDSMTLIHPVFKYEQYEHLDNLQMMFGEKGQNISAVQSDPEAFNLVLEIGRYVSTLGKNFFHSNYKINTLAIDSANFIYNDYSESEKFSIAAFPLTLKGDSINKNHRRVDLYLRSGIKPYGNGTIDLTLDPREDQDFDLQYSFEKIPASLFNPYIISYSSYPLDRGTIEAKGNWNVRSGNIYSDNHLLIVDPRVTKKVKNKDTKWLPMPLIMAFIRDWGNVIDYQIPITGNLKNPKFHLHDVIFDVLSNIFVKPVTTPYRMEIKDLENNIEKSLTLKWQMRQTELRPEQVAFLKKIVDFLAKNPEANMTVEPLQYEIKEKEYIEFFEAKKKYYLATHQMAANAFSKDDSETVAKMSVKDSSFIRYLGKFEKDSMLFTIQEKCKKFLGAGTVSEKFKELCRERERSFATAFQEKGVWKQVNMKPGKNIVPFNGFSTYKIDYKGELPDEFRKAFEKLQKLSDEAPRRKYKEERGKIK